ncbi:MAG TPA: choice-of-anchor Q domain-containing protein, partial [Kofleriaceae bacterium]
AGKLHLKGATFSIVVGHSSNAGVECGDFHVATVTHLDMEQVVFAGGYNQLDVLNCEATVKQSQFRGSFGQPILNVLQHSVLTLDRCWFDSDPARPSQPIQTIDVRDTIGARIHISNSVFTNVWDMFITQGNVDIEHSTFVNQLQLIDCAIDTEGADHGKRVYSNDLFVAGYGLNEVTKGNCEFHYSLMSSQVTPLTSADHMLLNVDPQLVDIAHGDFHLSPVSPAIDAADPTSMVPLDYDGHKRPEGPRPDIGAFELAP